jgi:thioesterase domain-containing protein
MYGITETTVHVTYRPIGRAETAGAGSVIGEAIPDLGLYVLDAASQPSPVGVPGEIHVGGAGLALGYLGRPELTAERFVPNPYGGPGSRLYRSGDLARRLADGDLEYLGRIDHQVKIRGFRIELGEIESALAAHPAVREAVVLAREDGGRHEERRLVAYVVPEGVAPSLSELREALAAGLPEYMLPSALVALDSFPLTANGKVDRRALPAPGMERAAGSERSFVAPATGLERFLAGFWQEVLGIPEVGVHDDFFALGGSSITGAVLISRLQEALGEIVHVMVIFNAPTIAEMAAVLVDQHAAAVERALGPGALVDRRPEAGGLPIPAVLVGLQPGGSQPPLFLVHPLSGELFLYRHLVAALGADQPVYGFQAVGFATDEEPLATVEAMAAVYVDALLSFQPRGPYLLAGSSLGGLIAFEMARALRSQGREVGFLALLDSPDPARFARDAEDAEGQAELSILQHVAQGGPGVSIEHLSALVPEERLRFILDHGRAAGILAASFGLPELRRLVRVVRANRSAVRAYEPRPFDTGLFYVKAAEGLGDDAVWAGLALGGAEVLEVPGSHLSMHFPPHAETLAARLRECVARERMGKNRES